MRASAFDLSVPLRDVTFCAVDLETTGGSARLNEIVEVGAVKSRGGVPLGTFSTLVRPGADLPLQIQLLTGISQSMLEDAAPLEAVLPAFLEFVHGAVFVAHNAPFDRSFIEQACRTLEYEPPGFLLIDTCRLARKVLREHLPDARLQTLARYFRTANKPVHRAFADAAACLEVLHGLLEHAAAWGVVSLGDLVQLQRTPTSPYTDKLRLVRDVPKGRGVYRFLNALGETIYVGKATDLRSRVRSYFVSDERRSIPSLLAEVASVTTMACATELDARAIEARLIELHRPRYNRRGYRRRAPAYVCLDESVRHPRFKVTSRPRRGQLAVGPFASRARARAAADVISAAFGMRTCSLDLPDGCELSPCPAYAAGSCAGPCTGTADDVGGHDVAVRALRADLEACLDRTRAGVSARIARLIEQRRFEEAKQVQSAFDDLAAAVAQARTLGALAAAGTIELEIEDGRVVLQDGRLSGVTGMEPPPLLEAPAPPDFGPLALSTIGLEERRAIAGWLKQARGIRLARSTNPLAFPWPPARPLESADVARAAPGPNS
jgi:DNA polymerase-3 subunit epsilon